MRKKIDKETLNNLYTIQKKSLSEIGKMYECDASLILYYMKKYNINRRSVKESLKGREIFWKDKIRQTNTGKLFSQQRKDNIRKGIIESFKNGRQTWNKGKTKRNNIELKNTGMSGINHWNWKGGISKENILIRQSGEYKEWRLKVFYRDNFTCQHCGTINKGIVAHHIESFCKHKDLRFDVDNGITLCSACHRELHRKNRQKHGGKFYEEKN